MMGNSTQVHSLLSQSLLVFVFQLMDCGLDPARGKAASCSRLCSLCPWFVRTFCYNWLLCVTDCGLGLGPYSCFIGGGWLVFSLLFSVMSRECKSRNKVKIPLLIHLWTEVKQVLLDSWERIFLCLPKAWPGSSPKQISAEMLIISMFPSSSV